MNYSFPRMYCNTQDRTCTRRSFTHKTYLCRCSLQRAKPAVHVCMTGNFRNHSETLPLCPKTKFIRLEMPSTAVGSEVTLRKSGFFFWLAMVAEGKGLMVAST